jgi:hypothetical protein
MRKMVKKLMNPVRLLREAKGMHNLTTDMFGLAGHGMKLRTVSGYDFGEVSSAMPKEIRRGSGGGAGLPPHAADHRRGVSPAREAAGRSLHASTRKISTPLRTIPVSSPVTLFPAQSNPTACVTSSRPTKADRCAKPLIGTRGNGCHMVRRTVQPGRTVKIAKR